MIIVLTGPTGSGKSELAISLAKKLKANIINADAFQVYEELNIATAKPSDAQFLQAPHFLFSFIPLDSSYNVAEYQKDLRACLAEFAKRGENVIIAGGTGLYIRAGLYDYEFTEESDVDLSRYEKMDNLSLHDELKRLDPISSEKIHPNNRRRVLRAIAICLSQGKAKSEIESAQEHKPLYDVCFYGITTEREEIYEKVNQRVEAMFEAGLLEENRRLVEKYGREQSAFKAIGVKECFPYFDGKISLEECKELIKKNTRNYIKRQLTFFRHQFPIKWISNEDEIMEDLQENG